MCAASPNRVRLGIVGAAAQGAFYAELITQGRVPHMMVGAMSGRSPATGALIAERFPEVAFFTDATELMDSGAVDAVVTTVPHYLHPQMAIDGMRRGLHVLVEKPLGVYTKQVQQMLDVAAATPGVRLAAMFNQRANPLYARIKGILESGEIGDLRRATWIATNWFRPQSYYDSSPWRGTWGGEGGGVLVNQAAHQMDLWHWLCGAPRTVWSKVPFGFAHNIDVEDDVTAVFNYGRAGTGVFITGTHDMMGTDRLEILADAGKIVVDDSRVATIHRLKKPMQEYSATMEAAAIQRLVRQELDWSQYRTTELIDAHAPHGTDHTAVLENFARAILHDEPLLAPAAEGMGAVRLSNAILLSAWKGREVPYDFDDDEFLAELNQRIAQEGRFPLRS
jgi:UDP-N-acetyl-2-amino-2-deoxyglucuronate dehydrogenase